MSTSPATFGDAAPTAVVQHAIVCFEGVDELDAIGPHRVLNGAARMGADLDCRFVTVGACETVTAGHGLTFDVEGTLDEASPDVLVIPGGGWADRAAQGVAAERERGAIPAAIDRLAAAGTTIASVCTGALLVADAGLLTGRPATTHASGRDALAAAGASLRDDRVVDDGDVITAGGVTAGIDLGLHLLERAYNEGLATAVADAIAYPPGA